MRIFYSVSINEGLLSDIGLSYGEIRKKYREMVDSDGYAGGSFYEFDHGPGKYFFRDRNGISFFSDGTGKITTPNDESTCFTILTNVNSLFHNFKGNKSISGIEDFLGVPSDYHEWDPNNAAVRAWILTVVHLTMVTAV